MGVHRSHQDSRPSGFPESWQGPWLGRLVPTYPCLDFLAAPVQGGGAEWRGEEAVGVKWPTGHSPFGRIYWGGEGNWVTLPFWLLPGG